MNFSFDASKAQQANQQTPAPGAQGFATGLTGAGDASKPLSTGFTLPSLQPQEKPSELFGSTLGTSTFGSQPAATAVSQAPGLQLGATSTGLAPLTFGTPATTTSSLYIGSGTFVPGGSVPFSSLMTPGAPQTSGFTLGGSTAATPASSAPKLTFGAPQATLATAGGFKLGGATPAPAASSATTTVSSFGLTTPATTSAQLSVGATTASTGFSLAPSSAAQPAASSFGLGQPASSTAATTASTGFSLGGTATSLASGFSLASSVASTIASGFSLGKTTASQATSTAVATTNTPQTTLGTVTTVSSASTAQGGSMNFCQLEESINKWTLDLEEQEKAFVNQAKEVNNWDKLLIANGEKIATLNQEVERVKLEQQQLEHELDYVVGQQKELQDCLVPLEKELASLSVADPERDYTYRLAENLDKQLKTMSENLKEIIEHLNEANRSQDSSDPIVQIGKILNAHMNSLQWLDQRTSVLGQKIQQIDEMHQNFRQENERSFNLAYN